VKDDQGQERDWSKAQGEELADWQPPWVKTLPGKHPALTREVTEAEILQAKAAQRRAMEMADSPLAIHLSADDQFLESARSRVASFKINLEAFSAEKPSSRSSYIIEELRDGLAKAYRDLGEWQKALETICDRNWHALSGFANLKAEILAWRKACERPDHERCDCQPPVLEVVSPHTEVLETMPVPEAQFSIAGKCYSHIHGKVVNVNRCCACGDLNAFEGVHPEMHAVEQLRAANHKHETIRDKFSDFQITK
jgi:hypothetical protein